MGLFSLGQKIRELRQKLGLTQVELANGIITASMVSQIESDRAKPSYKVLAKLASRLEVPLEKLLVDVDLNLEYVSTFKMGKAMAAAGEYHTAIPLLEQVLEVQNSGLSEMEILFELSECYLHTGALTKAKIHLEKLQEQAVFRHDHVMLAKSFRSLGLIAFKCKQYQLAVYFLKMALEEIEKRGQVDPFLKAGILHFLGDVHAKLGTLNEAILYYNDAFFLYKDCGSLNEVANIYLNIAQSYKRLHEYKFAVEYSERAIAIYSGLENLYMNVKVQIHTAILLGDSGQEEKAIQMLEQSILKLQELNKSDDVGMTYVELAKVQLVLGKTEEAEESCRIALSLLPELHKFQAVGNRVLGDIARERGQTKEAARMYQLAADCFKRIGEHGEWANTMTVISRLKLAENDCQSAYQIIEEVRYYTQLVLHGRGIVL